MSNIFDRKEKEKLAKGIIEELKDIHHLETDEARKVISYAYGLLGKELKEKDKS